MFLILKSVRKAASWTEVDLEEILEDYQDGFFDSPDIWTRNQIPDEDILNLPQMDESGRPIPLFCREGYPIQRRIPSFVSASPTFGVLLKYNNLESLFLNRVEDYDHSELGHTPFTFYPQAGLRTVGHFQASGLMAPCYPLLSRINKSLQKSLQSATNARELDSDSESSDEEMNSESDANSSDGSSWDSSAKKVIHGISSQGYNAVTHHTRGRTAQHHEVQVGMVTGALAGAWATGAGAMRTAEGLERSCSWRMPHKLFEEKIQKPGIARDLRLENVYWIDVGALKKKNQKGG